MQTVAIVGVGLIGGSFAAALRHAGFSGPILGVSSSESAAKALDAGIIDEAVPLESACASADVLFLAHRISRILELIPEIAQFHRPGLLVTDAGSTKGQICAAAARHLPSGSFLGGHPMAGKETRGIEGADALLFQGRTYILTPAVPSDLESPAIQQFVGWIRRIGARIMTMSPESHDQTVAFTSHLPQFASTALAQTVSLALPDPDSTAAAGPGLQDMTRLALSSYEIWRDIIGTNQEAISAAIDRYIEILSRLRTMSPGILENTFIRGAEAATRVRRTSYQEVPSKDSPIPPNPPSKDTP
ncbi:MAG: prephenate dehydrogenase/arogenate dehydrogenase family protein [Bryobacteraceae bacterium]|nr:prephenate dehydrogenase/arogenate dehydrogenase family protein [Bryobacteraceae bacterium]